MNFTVLVTLTFRIWNLRHNSLVEELHGFTAYVTGARCV